MMMKYFYLFLMMAMHQHNLQIRHNNVHKANLAQRPVPLRAHLPRSRGYGQWQ